MSRGETCKEQEWPGDWWKWCDDWRGAQPAMHPLAWRACDEYISVALLLTCGKGTDDSSLQARGALSLLPNKNGPSMIQFQPEHAPLHSGQWTPLSTVTEQWEHSHWPVRAAEHRTNLQQVQLGFCRLRRSESCQTKSAATWTESYWRVTDNRGPCGC